MRAIVLACAGIVAACAAPADPPADAATDNCMDCEPTVRRYAVLGGRGPGVGTLGYVARGSNGLYYVAHVHATSEIGVHRRDGSYVGAIGREGEGPGEFRNIMSLTLAADSLHVFDSRLARQTVFDERGAVARTRSLLPGILRAWVLPNGNVLVHRTCPTYLRDCGRDPFHVYDDTAASYSFGAVDDGDGRPVGREWSAGAVAEDGFWAARSGRYRLYRWNDAGVLVDSIIRTVPWFPDHDITPFRQGVRPGPIIRDIRVDSRERLWVLILVAGAGWADQFRDAPSPDMRFNGNMEGYFDSVLEVIDLRSRTVVAQRRFSEYISRITNDFHLVAEKETPLGEPYLVIMEVRLPR